MLLHYPEKVFPEAGLSSLTEPVRIEVMAMKDDDHEFIVIKRRADSDPCDLHTFGSDYALCVASPTAKHKAGIELAMAGALRRFFGSRQQHLR